MKLTKKNTLDFNVWKITLINVRIIVSPKEYKKWGKDFLQKNYNLNNWNLKTVLHFFPFFFGFSNMIWSRYKDQTISSIFGETLPGTKLIKENVSWETFTFIKSKSINTKTVKQINIFPNSCIVQFKNPNKEKLIGIIFPTENIKNIQYNKLNSYQKNRFYRNFQIVFGDNVISKNLLSEIENIYYILDEIPQKIEPLLRYKENIEKNVNESIFTIQLDFVFQKNRSEKKENHFNKKSLNKVYLPKQFLDSKKKQTNEILCKGVFSAKRKELRKNDVLFDKKIDRLSETKKRIFQNEINSLFFIQGIEITGIANNFNAKLPIFSFPDYCSNETLQLLADFLKAKNIQFEDSRAFSGYMYPDFLREKIFNLALLSILNQSKLEPVLEIQLPSNFLTYLKNTFLINSNCCNPLPISSRKDNFLGVNGPNKEKEKKNLAKEIDWKNFISQETFNPENNPFDDFDDSDPDSWFLSFNQKDTKGINFEEAFFINFLKNKAKNGKFFINTPLFENQKLKYHFFPFTENFLIEKSSTSIKVGDIYKRIPTFTTYLNDTSFPLQKNSFSFFESWEPISLNSWLLITQLSIGLFLLQLVKDLYKDYGKELVEYILQFASSSGIDVEEIKEQYLYEDPGYRLIRKIKKSFKDIAGIDNILLELGEIVWFLRNNGRSAKFKNSIPNGILLTGPPGTGKTLLVQAIAGEAQVPIIVESGSLLTDPQQKGRGIERLKKIFDQARELAPCIIFIDEVDTLGEKRQNIIQTPMGSDELIESIYEKTSIEKNNKFIPKPLNLEEESRGEKDLEYQLFRGENDTTINTENEKFQQNVEAKKTRLNLLTQFLVELDGLKQRQGVIVIGATNRPNVLDPALIRPGRFDQILNLELPGKQKRIEIFKLYSKKLQVEKNLSWDYLAKRTKGFSAADIAAAMNESTIQAILSKTTHTIESIERGIDLVTSYNSNPTSSQTKKQLADPFFLSRLAYYQSGKAILQSILQNHPPSVVLHLWPRPKNARHIRLYGNSFSEITNKKTLEAQLIALYAGKASEILPLYGNKTFNSLKCWHSDIGEEDLISGTFLANLLVEKWYFYSIQILIQKSNQILNNRNDKEFKDIEKSQLGALIDNEIEDELEIEKIAKLSRLGRYQQRGFGPWWQIQTAKQISEIDSFFAEWYRIYLPDPEENILNLEWISPDEYHHSNKSLKKLSEKSTVSINELYQIKRDYIFHGLILNAFNTAFDSLEKKREFLDYFADYLLRFEIIRENEIGIILKSKQKTKTSKLNSLKILENFWGKDSRRKTSRFLNFDILDVLKTETRYQSPFFYFEKE